jgi:hypothetical protein
MGAPFTDEKAPRTRLDLIAALLLEALEGAEDIERPEEDSSAAVA